MRQASGDVWQIARSFALQPFAWPDERDNTQPLCCLLANRLACLILGVTLGALQLR